MITVFLPIQKQPAGYGHYRIFLHTQEHGKMEAFTTNMPLIDKMDSDDDKEREEAHEEAAEYVIRQERPDTDIVMYWDKQNHTTMTTEQLQIANELHAKITKLREALNCFEYEGPETDRIGPIDLHPMLIIQHDDNVDWDGGRMEHHLPIELSEEFVAYLKRFIEGEIIVLESKFSLI
jgi:hypothetical protein